MNCGYCICLIIKLSNKAKVLHHSLGNLRLQGRTRLSTNAILSIIRGIAIECSVIMSMYVSSVQQHTRLSRAGLIMNGTTLFVQDIQIAPSFFQFSEHKPLLELGFQAEPKPELKLASCPDIWALGKSPINTDLVIYCLKEYPKKDVVEELSDGLVNRFRLNYTGPRTFRESRNLISAYQYETQLKEKIEKEISLGRVMGPFDTLPISKLQISPIGLVPKSDGGWRLITHLSYPNDHGINQFIDPVHCTVKYSSFDNVINMLTHLGRRAEMGVLDIKTVFRLLRVHPADFAFLGFKFIKKYYIDKSLPMGCSRSCRLFESFSTFLHWYVEQKSGLSTLDHYLDDFFFAGKEGSGNCKKLMDCFSDTCHEFGIPLASDKSVGSVTMLTFLGLDIDTENMLIKIPQSKLDALVQMLEQFLTGKKITLKDLQSLVGSLSFFGKAISSSRAFNRRFYDLMAHAKKPHHFIKLRAEVKEDMRMWLCFLRSFNGKTYFPESVWTSNDTIMLFTDSAAGAGTEGAAYLSGEWVFFQWPENWVKSDIIGNITFLEFVPVVLAMSVWGHKLQNKKIIFNIDNMSLVHILNSQTSKSKAVMNVVNEAFCYPCYAKQCNISS